MTRAGRENYQVKLTVDGQTMTQTFEVKSDPRLTTSVADYAKQLDLSSKIRRKLIETHNAIIQIRDVKKQIDNLVKRVGVKWINRAQPQKLSQIIKTDVPAFNQLVRDQNIPAIVVKPSSTSP